MNDPGTGTTTPPAIPGLFTPSSIANVHASALLAQPATQGDFIAGGGIGLAVGAAIVWLLLRKR